MTGPAYVVRDATPDDRAFIVNAWLRSFRHRIPHHDLIDDATYLGAHTGVIANLMQSSRCLVAEVAGELLGFVVGRDLLQIHYVYVKNAWRRLGIGAALVSFLGVPEHVEVSHVTEPFKLLAKSMNLQFSYNPYQW